MSFLFYALGVLAIGFGVAPLWLSIRFRRYVLAKLVEPLVSFTPPAAVMVPCKGTDLEFRQNILSVLDQDYPDVEFLFVTGTEDDPAHADLARLIAERPSRRAKLLVAGTSDRRAQKLTNLLYAVDRASPDRQVLVHLDADIRLRPDFLHYLIAPLRTDSVGATTGFPWYVPLRARLGSIMRSIWGGGALPLLIDNRYNIASGAANALRKEVYEASGVRQAMDGSVSDTFAITGSVKRMGKEVVFVPQCLFMTPDDSTLIETIHWTTRQTTISRVYGPKFWWTVALSYSFATALVLLGIVLLIVGIARGSPALTAPALLILSLIPLQAVNASILLRVVQAMLPEQAIQLERMKWKYMALAPFGSILIFLNSVLSRLTNEINWRGIRYRLISPTQTEVLDARQE
jgi:cellulose synthase/poly-beta-1,6-N-acetylglucosamine synthase-like glycosyltransferase